jgi:hypothetical protein
VHVASVFVPRISLVLLTKNLWEFFWICTLHCNFFDQLRNIQHYGERNRGNELMIMGGHIATPQGS